MSNRGAYIFLPLVALLAPAPAGAQSVISTHAGVVHFFEGAVYLGDHKLESHLGKFPTVPQGAELRTEEGRAEVLLTPGVFLRMGDRSAIRLVSNDLGDTQVALLAGSAIVDSSEPNPDTSVTLLYRDWRVHAPGKGVYRIDSDPPRVSVQRGEAEVYTGTGGDPVAVEHGMSLPFAEVLVPEGPDEQAHVQANDQANDQAIDQPGDALGDWENGRSQSIVADNAIAAQIDEDPALHTADLDGFTYFPFLDLPYLGMGLSGAYSSYAPYQSGFSSIYLPGYSYRPIMLGLLGRGGLGIYAPSAPVRIGVTRGYGGIGPYPRAPIPRAPLPIGPMHAGPAIGAHAGRR